MGVEPNSSAIVVPSKPSVNSSSSRPPLVIHVTRDFKSKALVGSAGT